MKVDRFFSASTARLPGFDARRLERVPGGDGTVPVPEGGREAERLASASRHAWALPAPSGAWIPAEPFQHWPRAMRPLTAAQGPGSSLSQNAIKPGAPSDSCAEPKKQLQCDSSQETIDERTIR